MRARAAVAVVLFAMLALVGCSGSPSADSALISQYAAKDRKAAPQLDGLLLDGSTRFSLAEHSGDVVVVNFWASWCSPCRVEATDLEQTYAATKASGVTFVGINVNDQRDKAVAFAVDSTYPSIFDPTSKLALQSAVPPTSIPATMIIDRQGRIAVMIRGAILRDALQPLVEAVAAEHTAAQSGGS